MGREVVEGNERCILGEVIANAEEKRNRRRLALVRKGFHETSGDTVVQTSRQRKNKLCGYLGESRFVRGIGKASRMSGRESCLKAINTTNVAEQMRRDIGRTI